MKVLKFGGSSITPLGLSNMCKIIEENKDNKLILVFSAIKNITNLLYETANRGNTCFNEIRNIHIKMLEELELDLDLLDEEFKIMYDLIEELNTNPIDTFHSIKKIKIIGFGEILSTKIIYNYLKNIFENIKLLNSLRFIMNENNHKDIDKSTLSMGGEFYCDNEVLLNLIRDNQISIVQGFIAKTQDEYMCLMSRSGSDTTASLIGSSLKAPVEIWTDVSGIFTGDPRIIPNAKIIDKVSYDICQEISTMGSHVIHPLSIEPCKKNNIKMSIRNTYDYNNSGTDISSITNKIYAISLQKNIKIIEIKSLNMWNQSGFVSKIFKHFDKYEIDINIIITSFNSVSITTEEQNINKLFKLRNDLEKEFDHINYEEEYCLVSLIGNDLFMITNDVYSKYENDILFYHPSTNRMSISFAIKNKLCNSFARDLHDHFIF